MNASRSGSLTVASYRLGALASRLVPMAVTDAVAAGVAIPALFASGDKRRMVERHLNRAVPGLSPGRRRRMVTAVFDNYARYYLESFRLPSISPRAVERNFSIEGFEHVEHGLEAGRGVVVALPHLGGWEWAGRWITDKGIPMTVVVERLDPPELFEWFVALRRDFGMTVVPLGPEAGSAVLGALRRNEIVCLLSDRFISGSSVAVEFLGERTLLPAGPATLAIRTGAPLLPTAVYFDGRGSGHHAVVRPPVDTSRGNDSLRDAVQRCTQNLADEIGSLIRRAPEQWHLLQPNWPSDPGWAHGSLVTGTTE
ncbi:MAG: phosphatidylinositol mannoside acyltransferase [Ilumatobacteraceae bacterium]